MTSQKEEGRVRKRPQSYPVPHSTASSLPAVSFLLIFARLSDKEWKAADKTTYLIPTIWPSGPTEELVGVTPPLYLDHQDLDLNLNMGLTEPDTCTLED